MKGIFLGLIYIFCTSLIPPSPPLLVDRHSASDNVFVIVTDGFRWQEVFKGADSMLIHDERFTPDTASVKAMYWAGTEEERRRRLLPFFWNVIARKGQLLGNRSLNSQLDVANLYAVSYPGYSEIFTGTTDPFIFDNSKKLNPNRNVLEYLAKIDSFRDSIAIFSSWDMFPYILNQQRNGLTINSGYQEMNDDGETTLRVNQVQESNVIEKTDCRFDQLTFTIAKEYIKKHSPRVVVIGLGETDEFAHQGRYDLYLQQANQFDRMLAELWTLVQTSPVYKDRTSFIITTDHGRGRRNWTKHGIFINGSSQTWLALLGPKIPGRGEVAGSGQHYNRQMATMIAHLAGEEFK